MLSVPSTSSDSTKKILGDLNSVLEQGVWEWVDLGRVVPPFSDLVVRVVKWFLKEEKDSRHQLLESCFEEFTVCVCRQFGLEILSRRDGYGLKEFFDLWKDAAFKEKLDSEPREEAQWKMIFEEINIHMRLNRPTAVLSFERACRKMKKQMIKTMNSCTQTWAAGYPSHEFDDVGYTSHEPDAAELDIVEPDATKLDAFETDTVDCWISFSDVSKSMNTSAILVSVVRAFAMPKAIFNPLFQVNNLDLSAYACQTHSPGEWSEVFGLLLKTSMQTGIHDNAAVKTLLAVGVVVG